MKIFLMKPGKRQILFALYRMLTVTLLFGSSLFESQSVLAQSKMNVLEIPKNGTFEMQGDSLVVDQLIMHEASTLVLHRDSKVSYIKASEIIISVNCTIKGIGAAGTDGRKGADALPPTGLCK